MVILFYYDNQTNNGAPILQAPLQLILPYQIPVSPGGNVSMGYMVTSQQLLSLIFYSIQPEAGVTRYPDSLGVVFTTGTGDLNTYIQLTQPNTGINQDIASYSDITNGIGLFTARHIQTFYKKIDNGVLDSLATEPRFAALGFLQ